MERLTEKRDTPLVMSMWCGTSGELKIYNRLAEIENILGEDYDLDRLRQLVEADRDGRCVVLPCKEGEKLKRDGVEFAADHWNIRLTAFAEDPSTASGKRVELFGIEGAKNAIKRVEE